MGKTLNYVVWLEEEVSKLNLVLQAKEIYIEKLQKEVEGLKKKTPSPSRIWVNEDSI